MIDDGRTIILATDPHPRIGRYVLPLSDTAYSLSGVEAAWSERDNASDDHDRLGWWPRLDLDATRRLTRGSKPHEQGIAQLSRPGRLTLSTLIRLPAGKGSLQIDSSGTIEESMLGDARRGESTPDPKDGSHHAVLNVESRGEPLFLSTTLR